MTTSDRYLPEGWVLPAIDELTTEFFTSGELRLESCTACGHVQHPPLGVCSGCQRLDLLEYRAVAPTGTIASYTIVHHPVSPQLADHVPYNVILVELDAFPNVRITGNLLGVAPSEVTIGAAVVGSWTDPIPNSNGTGVRLLQWSLATGPA